jgi:acyl-CoA thioester hydrolase
MSEDDSALGPTSGRFDGAVHSLPVRIYYEDTDFSGVVYHSNYLRYCERGRSDFLRLAGIHHAELLSGDSPTAFAVNRIELDFLKPARIDDALVVETRFERFQGPRVFVSQTIRRGQEVLVKAALEVCCIGLSGRPKKPPMLLVERLKPFLRGSSSSF